MKLNFGSAKSRNLRTLLVGGGLVMIALVSSYLWLKQEGSPDEMLIAKSSLPAGTRITTGDFRAAEVSLGAQNMNYLRPDELPVGSYLLGPIREGELLPKSQIATQLLDERAPVVVNSAMPLASGLVPGASVDLWATAEPESGPALPRLLIESAEVAALIKPEGMFSVEDLAVELWVPLPAVSEVLAAQVSGEKFGLVVRPTLLDRARW